MPKLPLALAAASLGALLALAPTRPALAANPPTLASGDESASAACGQGHAYLCYIVYTYKCVAWNWVVDGAGRLSYVCTTYTTLVEYVYRDM